MTDDVGRDAEERTSGQANAGMTSIPDSVLDTAVAVVGMSARLPGARDPETFWENLRAGTESVQDLTRNELEARGVDPKLLDDPAYVYRAATLDGAGEWDAGFWGFSRREAAVMDPQIRHFIELCWEGMEKAGYAPGTFTGPVGVFGGCGPNTYMMFQLLGDPDILRDMGFFLVRHIGNDKDFLATRASYHLNLTGPGVGVQTACSTSLTAIHLAVQSLLAFECDMALAGGVTITFPHRLGYRFHEGEILSPDGTCRAFDAGSQGTVLGDGGAVVVLRRLRDAMEDGDTIHAVIRGRPSTTTGPPRSGIWRQAWRGQARVVTEALAVADVTADTIGYVEAHGTGTRVGDPIEVAALTEAYRAHTQRRGYCWLGSVKTNIGHLDTAAGVAGFLKAALAVRDGVIPPSLHFQSPNPGLALESSPFRIPPRRSPFPRLPIPAGRR
jgi:acyl transferase domain-containing protein